MLWRRMNFFSHPSEAWKEGLWSLMAVLALSHSICVETQRWRSRILSSYSSNFSSTSFGYDSFLPALYLPLGNNLLFLLGFGAWNNEVLLLSSLNQRWTFFRAMLNFLAAALIPWCLAYSTTLSFCLQEYWHRTLFVLGLLARLLLLSCPLSSADRFWGWGVPWSKFSCSLVDVFLGRPTGLFIGVVAGKARGVLAAA